MQKAWNIGAGSLGVVIAFAPYVVARMIEFFLPFMGTFLSSLAIGFGSLVGGVIVGALAIPLYPIKHIIAKLMDGVDFIRDKILTGIAILYAKNNQSLANYQDCCIPDALHSPEFVQRVDDARRSTWRDLIFGPMRAENAAPVAPVVQVVSVAPVAPPLPSLIVKRDRVEGSDDVITHEPLGQNGSLVVQDPHGHLFNDDATGRRTQGIRFWVQQHHTCPLDRAPLTEVELSPVIVQ